MAEAFSSRGVFLVRQGPKINKRALSGDEAGRKGSLQHPSVRVEVGFFIPNRAEDSCLQKLCPS